MDELIYAIKKGNLKLVKSLIEKGVDIEHNDNYTPLMYAVEEGHLDIVKFLIEKGGVNIHTLGDESLILASGNGYLEIVKYLLSKGADIEAREKHNNDNTPLISATSYGHLDIVKYLIDKGADLYAQDDHGNISLDNAKHNNDINCINFLETEMKIRKSIKDKTYDKTMRKEFVIKALEKDPSLLNNLEKKDKNLIKNVPKIQHLLKSDEYGLFERKIMNFTKYIKQK